MLNIQYFYNMWLDLKDIFFFMLFYTTQLCSAVNDYYTHSMTSILLIASFCGFNMMSVEISYRFLLVEI